MSGLRIVDNDNVRTLPVGHVRDVAAAIRSFAGCIEDGSLTARKAILITVDEDGMLDFSCFGELVNSAEGLGLLDLTKAKIVAGSWR
jgi:hypothetical protein